MKKFNIPPVLAYIILLGCIGILVFGVSRLSYILGSIYKYSIGIFLAFAVVVIVVHSILDGKR